jgi:hypothetical protein
MINNTCSRVVTLIKNPRLALARLETKIYLAKIDKQLKKHFLQESSKNNAIILASFPKSGNTFMRFVFANIIALTELDKSTINFQKLDEIMPSTQFEEDLYNDWKFKSIPCVLKTHALHRKIFSAFRCLFLYRDPLDTMVSNYFYWSNRTGAPPALNSANEKKRMHSTIFQGSPSDYLRKNLEHWCQHYNSWINHCSLICNYELLMTHPEVEFKKILEHFDIQVESSILKEAIAKSNIKEVKKLESKIGKSDKMAQLKIPFARSGKSEQWRDLFSKEDINFACKVLEQHGIPENIINKYRYTTHSRA